MAVALLRKGNMRGESYRADARLRFREQMILVATTMGYNPFTVNAAQW